MDSLTQIVLGAAMGEVALGKKLGNRAMVWGALGGTIPDLDIIGNLFMDKVDALAFHRGISHSFTFSIIACFAMAYLTHRLYRWKEKHWAEFSLASVFYVLIVTGLTGILYVISKSWIVIGLTIAVGLYGWYTIYRDYVLDKENYQTPTIKEWRWLWFLALVTHPILDSFTQYGTQLFAPFSDYRVAFNNISVADPLYTGLFLIGLLGASLFHRTSNRRRIMNWVGIALSSAYMIFTGINKLQTDKVMLSTIESKNLDYTRYTISPSILNNVLWSGTVETDTAYFQGLYSMMDSDKNFKLIEVEKNHHLIADAKEDDKTINTLKWFSNGFYSVLVRRDGRLQFNDMRYGTFRGEAQGEDDFIFRFVIEKGKDGYYTMMSEEGGPPEGTEEDMMGDLIERVKGI